MAERRVVITGLGAVSPVGNTADLMWENMKAGKNGIDYITRFDTEDYPVKVAGEVRDFDAAALLGKKEARRMDRFCQFGVAAGIQAMEDANFGDNMPDPYRFGLIIGSGIGGIETMYNESIKLHEKGYRKMNPLFVPIMISNMAAGNLSIRYGLKGHCTCVVTACATGTHAIGDAFHVIKYGQADAMLAGGAEATITPLAVGGFVGISALSTSQDPNRASIPFDKERTGFVMGEGAGVVVLEEYEHAKKRGAKIYAEVLGYGATADAYHMTAPDPEAEGCVHAMRLCLEEAGIQPDQVNYINAHGTSTLYNDKTEALAIKKLFGESTKVAVSSTKSMTGHLLGAAGAIEAIACAKAIVEGYLPPTINYQVKDEECDLDVVPNQGRQQEVKYAISNSLGFGGHNASLLFGKL